MQGSEINLVLGDASLEGNTSFSSENDKIAAHLRYVEALLRNAGTTTEEREQNIQNLHNYWHQGVFPLGEHDEDIARKPNFKDSKGTLCAVGYLIQQSPYGGDDLVGLIARQHQFSYIKDMHVPELLAWQEKSGLSAIELAMIQPTYEFYIAPAQEIVRIMARYADAQPDSEEKALLDEAEKYWKKMQRDNLYYGWNSTRQYYAKQFQAELGAWEAQHQGKKKVADEYVAKVRAITDSWIAPPTTSDKGDKN